MGSARMDFYNYRTATAKVKDGRQEYDEADRSEWKKVKTSAFMFKYSERPGTYASKHLPDDVPEEVKIRRLNEIIELQNRLSAESNARDVGKTFEVMVEGVSKRSREQLFGRTQQNKVVVFDRGNHRIGDFVHVRITEASSATLKGEEVF